MILYWDHSFYHLEWGRRILQYCQTPIICSIKSGEPIPYIRINDEVHIIDIYQESMSQSFPLSINWYT